jgi:hypothetical protein
MGSQPVPCERRYAVGMRGELQWPARRRDHDKQDYSGKDHPLITLIYSCKIAIFSLYYYKALSTNENPQGKSA